MNNAYFNSAFFQKVKALMHSEGITEAAAVRRVVVSDPDLHERAVNGDVASDIDIMPAAGTTTTAIRTASTQAATASTGAAAPPTVNDAAVNRLIGQYSKLTREQAQNLIRSHGLNYMDVKRVPGAGDGRDIRGKRAA